MSFNKGDEFFILAKGHEVDRNLKLPELWDIPRLYRNF